LNAKAKARRREKKLAGVKEGMELDFGNILFYYPGIPRVVLGDWIGED